MPGRDKTSQSYRPPKTGKRRNEAMGGGSLGYTERKGVYKIMVVYIAIALTLLVLAGLLALLIALTVQSPKGPWSLVRRARVKGIKSKSKSGRGTGFVREVDPKEADVSRRLKKYIGGSGPWKTR